MAMQFAGPLQAALVLEVQENLFLIQKLFILRLSDTIGSQIAFFLNFYRNLPQYPLLQHPRKVKGILSTSCVIFLCSKLLSISVLTFIK
jgi:hypothetical protein